MYRIVTLSLFIAVPFALAIPPTTTEKPKAPKAWDGWSGYWECSGGEGADGKYTGVVTISHERSVYVVQWSLGSTTFIGVGHVVDDKLCIGWAQKRGDTIARGITVYAKQADGSVKGEWSSIPGDGSKNKESLSLLKKVVGE